MSKGAVHFSRLRASTVLAALLVALTLAPQAQAGSGGQAGAHLSLGQRAAAADASQSPSAFPISIQANLAHVGYVGVTITGPPGAQVQLSEQLDGSTLPIEVVVLVSGTADLPRALSWRCDRRTRDLVASVVPPTVALQGTARIVTPSCAKRLIARIGRRVRVDHPLNIALRDRWGIGGILFQLCVGAPAARTICKASQLAAGKQRLMLHVSTPRPGGWRITVETAYGFKATVLVWASHPDNRIQLLAAGDSEMQLLDDFLAQDLQPLGVNVTSDARISTGLTNPFFFNWQSHARQQAAALRPDVTVVFIGANDGYSISGAHGQPVACCNSAWSAGYANLVAQLIATYLRGTAGRVYWFVLPAPRPANFQHVFNAINSGIRQAAARFPERVGLIDANAFYTPHNRYRDYMTYRGRGFVIHESDGIHLSTASDRIAATLVVRQMLADRVIR